MMWIGGSLDRKHMPYCPYQVINHESSAIEPALPHTTSNSFHASATLDTIIRHNATSEQDLDRDRHCKSNE